MTIGCFRLHENNLGLVTAKRLMQATVHGDDLAGGFAQTLRDEQEICFGLVGGRDRRFCERAVGVKLHELFHERCTSRPTPESFAASPSSQRLLMR
jgi:hypothetical protein